MECLCVGGGANGRRISLDNLPQQLVLEVQMTGTDFSKSVQQQPYRRHDFFSSSNSYVCIYAPLEMSSHDIMERLIGRYPQEVRS